MFRLFTLFNFFEIFNSFGISVRNNKYTLSGNCLCWCGTERPGSKSFVTFLRAVMFRLFAFTFTFARVLRGRESSSSINSRCRFFLIISMQSPGPIYCLRGSWLSAPAVRKFEVGPLITVFAFLLEHTLHISESF